MAAKITWTNPFPADVGVVLFVRARTPSTRGECSITLNGAIDALRVTFAGNPIQATWTTGDSLSVRLNPFGVRDPKLLVMTGDGLTLIDYDLDRGHGLAPRVVERRLVGAAFPGRLYLSPETIADEGVATFYRTGPLDSDGDGLDNVLEAELGLDPAEEIGTTMVSMTDGSSTASTTSRSIPGARTRW